ncbi:MAG: cytochrome c [Bryobacteraceae bacterium]
MKARIALVSCCLLAGAGFLPTVRASAEKSVRDGIYTDAQAERGKALYEKACQSCHRPNLKGHGQTPSLAGDSFVQKWDGQTMGDLFEKTQTSMPADHPGSLSREDNAAILAYVLQANKYAAGTEELPTDSEQLAKIRFEAAKGQ